MSSAVSTFLSRNSDISLVSGRLGRLSPVRGIVHPKELSKLSLSGGVAIPSHWLLSFSSSSVRGSTSRSGREGLTSGREFVSRMRRSRQNAFTTSRTTTTRQRIFSPFRLAAISHKSSVYWIICSSNATRLYRGDFAVQNLV